MKPPLAILVLLPTLAFGQADVPRVSVDARGEDVREVLATLFSQVHRPYALDAAIAGKLYVSFDRMPFPKALNVVLAQANLVARDQDGVTLIAPAPKPVPPKTIPPKRIVVPSPKPIASAVEPAPVPATTLNRRVATRLSRAPLAEVFAVLGKQAGVPIEVDPSVPAYRIDAYFAKTSLRYALDRICEAANLRYQASATGIRIVRS